MSEACSRSMVTMMGLMVRQEAPDCAIKASTSQTYAALAKKPGSGAHLRTTVHPANVKQTKQAECPIPPSHACIDPFRQGLARTCRTL